MTAEEDEEAVNGKKLLLGGVDAKERSGGSDSDDWRADFKKGKQKQNENEIEIVIKWNVGFG